MTPECVTSSHSACDWYIWPDTDGPASPAFCECGCHAEPRDRIMSGPVHIRQKALANRRVTRDTYGAFDGDPTRKTLCGAPAGLDMDWAETRHAGPRKYVTCTDCLSMRVAAIAGAS